MESRAASASAKNSPNAGVAHQALPSGPLKRRANSGPTSQSQASLAAPEPDPAVPDAQAEGMQQVPGRAQFQMVRLVQLRVQLFEVSLAAQGIDLFPQHRAAEFR